MVRGGLAMVVRDVVVVALECFSQMSDVEAWNLFRIIQNFIEVTTKYPIMFRFLCRN